MVDHGPKFEYFAKSWIVDHRDAAEQVFEDINANITTSGQRLLGAAVGSDDYVEETGIGPESQRG